MTTSTIQSASYLGLPNTLLINQAPESSQNEENQLSGELTPFQIKFYRKVTKYPEHPLYDWIARFADKVSCYDGEIREAGMRLADRMLKFRPESKIGQAVQDHLDELVYTANFLDKSINEDPLALNQAKKILDIFAQSVEVTTKRCTLTAPNEVPEELEVNPLFVADPRITLYNLLTKSGDLQLSAADDTIQMRIGLILAGFRKELLQRLIPEDEKDRIHQVLFLENKLQTNLVFIERRGEVAVSDESKVNRFYKSYSISAFKDWVLKGGNDLYTYTQENGQKSRQYVAIEKRQGYANTEIVIDHVFKVINDQYDSWSGCLRSQLQEQGESDLSERLCQYTGEGGGVITRAGIRALLFSTEYLRVPVASFRTVS